MPHTIVRPGQADNAGDQHALNLKVFSGEVIAEFLAANVAMGRTRVKPMKKGAKSESFMAHGQLSSQYHVPGENILFDGSYLQTMAQGERLIHADREALSPVLIPNLLEMLNHWNDRQEYAMEMGRALAKRADQNIFRVIARAARGYDTAPYTNAPTGLYINNGGVYTAANVLDRLLEAQEFMDNNDVPEEGRVFFTTPAIIRTLLSSAATYEYIDKDLNPENGSLSEGVVRRIAGFELVKTNQLPNTNFTDTSNQLSASVANDYRVNMNPTGGSPAGSGTIGLCYQTMGVGTVRGADISLESEYKLELRGDLVVTSYLMAHGILRPECCVELAEGAKPAAP